MANETLLTIVGNTTAPVELRFTQSGAAVANWTVASTPRSFDKSKNEWVDGETLFMRCTAWREMAENAAESLNDKGIRVVVTGRLKARSYDDKQTGKKRTSYEIDADEIGPSLKYATARVTKTERRNGNAATPNSSQSWGQPQTQTDPWQGQPQQTSWDAPSNGPAPF